MKKTDGHKRCHREVCNNKADYYNLSTREWYCGECAALIQGYENIQADPGCVFTEFYNGPVKLFKHTGDGFYGMGSCVMVRVPNRRIAEELISVELESLGLETEDLNVKEIRMKGVIHSESGEY